MNAYAASFARENACLHSQWTAFGMVLADALTRLSGEPWSPADHGELHSTRHYVAWSILRADGFRLRIASHAGGGVASMKWPNERSNVVLDGAAPMPFKARSAIHTINPWSDRDAIAEDILATVVEPMEPLYAQIREAAGKRGRMVKALESASAALGAVLASDAADPQDREGRSHIVSRGSAFGRVRLSRNGSGSIEINGLSHATVIDIAQLIARQEAVR